jgi:hypothetical protein
MSLALDRTGIIAIGRKFFPGNDERRFIHAATGYLDLEEGMPRIFSLNGTKFFLFECNDIKAPYHNAGKFKNPGIDVGLNLIHRINEKGQPLSQENNFACIFGARTSYEWRIPVFLSVIFFRKTVPDCWPSGVLCTRATNYRVGYDEIRLSDSSHEVVPVAEGYAAVRIFRNLRSQILQKNETSHADEAAPAKNSGMGAIPVSKDQEGNKRQPRKDQFTIPAGKYRPRFEDVIRNFRSVVPENRKMKLTSSKSNCIILEDGLPEGIRYEFDDWQDRISIEIDLSPALSPQYEKNLSDLAHLEIEGLPVPELSKQTNGWLRLQYFFPENVPVPELVKAMNVLIEKSSMIFCTR